MCCYPKSSLQKRTWPPPDSDDASPPPLPSLFRRTFFFSSSFSDIFVIAGLFSEITLSDGLHSATCPGWPATLTRFRRLRCFISVCVSSETESSAVAADSWNCCEPKQGTTSSNKYFISYTLPHLITSLPFIKKNFWGFNLKKIYVWNWFLERLIFEDIYRSCHRLRNWSDDSLCGTKAIYRKKLRILTLWLTWLRGHDLLYYYETAFVWSYLKPELVYSWFT